MDLVIELLPKIRSSFAHPKMHSIVSPGLAVDSLIIAAGIINQLWAKPNG